MFWEGKAHVWRHCYVFGWNDFLVNTTEMFHKRQRNILNPAFAIQVISSVIVIFTSFSDIDDPK